MKREEVDLNIVMDNIKTDLELLIKEKKVDLLYGNLPLVKGIPIQISQLFLNLISNSIKFCTKTPVIRIDAEIISNNALPDNEMPAGTYVKLAFTDNGIGFEQKYADQIFTIFQRLHNTGDYEGTGIGLALCKKIVDNHRGRIDVTSEPGVGTVVTILLPVI